MIWKVCYIYLLKEDVKSFQLMAFLKAWNTNTKFKKRIIKFRTKVFTRTENNFDIIFYQPAYKPKPQTTMKCPLHFLKRVCGCIFNRIHFLYTTMIRL